MEHSPDDEMVTLGQVVVWARDHEGLDAAWRSEDGSSLAAIGVWDELLALVDLRTRRRAPELDRSLNLDLFSRHVFEWRSGADSDELEVVARAEGVFTDGQIASLLDEIRLVVESAVEYGLAVRDGLDSRFPPGFDLGYLCEEVLEVPMIRLEGE